MAENEALVPMIAKAIKAADKKYFNEDYTAQALAVISTLRRAGLAIVPTTPTDDMVDFAKESLTYGRQKPQDMLKTVYTSMVRRASGADR